jgi:rhodanese-related sulfurtransferase
MFMPQLYAGDLSALKTWDILKENPNAKLIDVRTDAEWHYVGVVDLNVLHKQPILLEWRVLPNMSVNQSFLVALNEQVPNKEDVLFFLCRTGGRSKEAAIAATGIGYKACYNIEFGFEGELNAQHKRGLLNGWKASGLAWRQD